MFFQLLKYLIFIFSWL